MKKYVYSVFRKSIFKRKVFLVFRLEFENKKTGKKTIRFDSVIYELTSLPVNTTQIKELEYYYSDNIRRRYVRDFLENNNIIATITFIQKVTYGISELLYELQRWITRKKLILRRRIARK